ncbi:MAG: hypothetical protein HRU26_02330 [Psychroserpens sp.]|nr:hypothetical protein [Psychroserpens sp.]
MKIEKTNIEENEIAIENAVIPKKKYYLVAVYDDVNCRWNLPYCYESRNEAMRGANSNTRIYEIWLPEVGLE